MAQWGNFQVSRPDIQITGANTAVEVERLTAATVPHGIFFDYLVPKVSFVASQYDDVIAPIAEGIERAYGTWNAVAASYREELDANGLVGFFMDFTIEVPSPNPGQIGPFQGLVSVPLLALGEALLFDTLINPEFQKVHDAIMAAINT